MNRPSQVSRPFRPFVPDQDQVLDQFSRLPSRRHYLTCGVYMLKDFDLVDQFGNIPPHQRSHRLLHLENSIRIDDELAPNINSSIFIVDPMNTTNTALCICQHEKWPFSFH